MDNFIFYWFNSFYGDLLEALSAGTVPDVVDNNANYRLGKGRFAL